MIWKALIPPAVLPLLISLLVALLGPGGLFGLTSDDAGSRPGQVADVNGSGGSSGSGGSTVGDFPPGTTATPTPPAFGTEPTPAHTDVPGEGTPAVTAAPSPGIPVPTLPPPPPPRATPTQAPPPGTTATPTPAGATPTPTPPPGPVITAAVACARVRAYMQAEMATISVVFNWCSATWLGTAWGVTWEIRNPLCAAFDALGLPCAHLPIQANFYHYDAINSTVAADAATELLLLTY